MVGKVGEEKIGEHKGEERETRQELVGVKDKRRDW